MTRTSIGIKRGIQNTVKKIILVWENYHSRFSSRVCDYCSHRYLAIFIGMNSSLLNEP